MALPDDGFLTPEIGSWGEDKYDLVKKYAEMFATSMKRKWDARAYVDLFSGPGRAKIEGSGKIVNGSPLIAIDVKDPFDKYIFCEENSEKLEALKARVQNHYASLNVAFIHGDANKVVKKILDELPYSSERKMLGFCFADPYKLKNLQFSTISALSERFMDFLILIPTGMDALRNRALYEKPTDITVANFLGDPEWRNLWQAAQKQGVKFDRFLIEAYERQMSNLNYIYGGTQDSVLIRSTEKKLRLYRLGFFSRHPRGQEFWNEARKYSQHQGDLFRD